MGVAEKMAYAPTSILPLNLETDLLIFRYTHDYTEHTLHLSVSLSS